MLIGAALAMEGHSRMLVRSIAMFICAIWLSLDAGSWISDSKWKAYWKACAFCATTSVLSCISMSAMYLFLSWTLEDQQTDVARNLSIFVDSIPAKDFWKTTFSVRNNSLMRLHGDIFCMLRRISDINANEFSGPWHKGVSAEIVEARGDVSTSDCLSFVEDVNTVMCADVEVKFLYTLETQTSERNSFSYRFEGRPENGIFKWTQRSLDKKESYCPTPHLPPFR